MSRIRYILFCLVVFVAVLLEGCTGGSATKRGQQPQNTVYTLRAAMAIYAYQPERALQIIDTAVIVGNLSEVRADMFRAKIYSETLAGEQMDSLLGGKARARFASARVIGERLLSHDSLKHNSGLRQDVLEVLAYTARQESDTVRWRVRSQQLVQACREQGAETEALRTEAELAASLYYSGLKTQGLARIDSVLVALNDLSIFRFNELDAFIIAAKRKIGVLNDMGRYVETIPLSRRIIELLDDFEKHPNRYHDGTYREPSPEMRPEYIRFYRSQAQNFITASYAALGERSSMEETFYELEHTVREAATREHQARYHALEMQMEADRRHAEAKHNRLIAWATSIVALLALWFAIYYWQQKRLLSRKNRHLANEISEALKYKALYRQEQQQLRSTTLQQPSSADLNALTNEQLFQYINEVIVSEQLFLDSKFGRQTIIDRFHLSKDRASSIFSQGSSHDSLTDYVQELRLEFAARLLTDQHEMSISQVSSQSGFASPQYFSRRFRLHFGMSPTDFRNSHRKV